MSNRIVLISCLALALPATARAQGSGGVAITGLVADAGGKPVKDARVALVGAGLSVRTDSAGKYSLIWPAVSLGRMDHSVTSGLPRMVGGGLFFQVPEGSRRVRISLFTLAGKAMGDLLDAELETGDYRFDPSHELAPVQVGLIRIQTGNRSLTFILPMVNRSGRGAGSPENVLQRVARPALGKLGAALEDTLEIMAMGYQREERAVSTYAGIHDFRLKVLQFADVPYRTGADLQAYERERCKLDVHKLGAAGNKLPILIHLHGGGLHGGDKNEGWFEGDNWFSRKLMEEGLLVFSPNYRLGYDPDLPKTGVRGYFPDYLEDAAAAVAWVKKNAEPYGGDPDNVFVSGYSGGSWLAAMLAMDTSYYHAIGFDPGAVRGYLAFSVQTYTYGQVAAERGISDRGISDAALLGHVRKHDIPMHVFVGGNETQRIADNRIWIDRMLAAGSANLFFSIQPGRDHKQIVTTMGNAADDTRAKVVDFIHRYSR